MNTIINFDLGLENIEVEDNVATIVVEEATIIVAVNEDGTETTEMTFTDGSQLTMTIDATNTETNVDVTGNIRTTVKVDSESTIETVVNIDGTVTLEVTSRGVTTEISTSVKGSDVSIDENGTVEIQSSIEKNGFRYETVITTNADGETKAKFIKIDIATEERVELSSTLGEESTFPSGNKTEIIVLDDVVYIKIVTPLDKILIIE